MKPVDTPSAAAFERLCEEPGGVSHPAPDRRCRQPVPAARTRAGFAAPSSARRLRHTAFQPAGFVEQFREQHLTLQLGHDGSSRLTGVHLGGGVAALVQGDIADADTAERVAAEALSRFDRIDTLVNNAGVFVAKPFTTQR